MIGSLAEHPAVLSPLRLLQQDGFPLTSLGLDANGGISAAELAEAMADGPALLALQWANNETGAVQPLPESAPSASRTPT